MKKMYTIKRNYNTGRLAVYEIHNGKKLWIKECFSKNVEDAKDEFLAFSESCKKEFIRLGGNPSEYPETEVVFYAD